MRWRIFWRGDAGGVEFIGVISLGVVFNEMKGAYSDAQQLFGQHLLNNILPSHTYSHSSGGWDLPPYYPTHSRDRVETRVNKIF